VAPVGRQVGFGDLGPVFWSAGLPPRIVSFAYFVVIGGSVANKQRKLWYLIGGALVIAFLAYGATSFKNNLTPYVSFDEAMKTASRVQVAGALVEGSSNYVDEDQKLHFVIVDEAGVEMAVRYSDVKPANFEEATQIVAVGSWRGNAFDAENLLVKCPSKYQGVDDDPSTHNEEA